MKFDYPIIDLHTHLRNDIAKHTKIAKESGVGIVVFMANTQPPLGSREDVIAVRKGLAVGTIYAQKYGIDEDFINNSISEITFDGENPFLKL